MKVLVVGGGGREHALAWKIRQSPMLQELICAPGNAGISQIATCLPIPAEDVDAVDSAARERSIDLVVVGPEAPLAAGLADRLRAGGRLVVGPTAAAATIETSKGFAKDLMASHGIPTAAYGIFDDPGAALAYAEKMGGRVVVKVDGLAAGKGVTVCGDLEEAREAIERALVKRAFGDAGKRVVVEERLSGVEASLIALTDGRRFLPLATAKDHKAVKDGDRGPNTGGMGVVSPAPTLPQACVGAALRTAIEPTLAALAERGRPFQGFLYAGLMLCEGRPFVLEFNARLGDPEAQGILVRLRSDLLPALVAAARGDLSGVALEWDERPSVTVVLASGGYPGRYASGFPIHGLEDAARLPDVEIFHAGTRLAGGEVVTAGGRVLAVTALGATIAEASRRAYEAAARIRFEGMHYRRDIGGATPAAWESSSDAEQR